MYMACRSLERGNKAKEQLLQESPEIKEENLIIIQLDLSSITSIRSFVKEFRKSKSLSYLNVFCACNNGIYFTIYLENNLIIEPIDITHTGSLIIVLS